MACLGRTHHTHHYHPCHLHRCTHHSHRLILYTTALIKLDCNTNCSNMMAIGYGGRRPPKICLRLNVGATCADEGCISAVIKPEAVCMCAQTRATIHPPNQAVDGVGRRLGPASCVSPKRPRSHSCASRSANASLDLLRTGKGGPPVATYYCRGQWPGETGSVEDGTLCALLLAYLFQITIESEIHGRRVIPARYEMGCWLVAKVCHREDLTVSLEKNARRRRCQPAGA